MSILSRLGIRGKLTLILLASSATAMTIASTAIIAYDRHRVRESMKLDLATLADITGLNSTAAMAFGDDKAAGEILEALSAKPAIVGAALYDRKGTLFASYRRADARANLPRDAHPWRDALHLARARRQSPGTAALRGAPASSIWPPTCRSSKRDRNNRCGSSPRSFWEASCSPCRCRGGSSA